MKAKITRDFLKKIKPQSKPFEIRDTETKGFILRVQPSGVMAYIAEYARGKRITVGQTSVLKLDEAREKARGYLASATLGDDPMEERKAAKAFTFEEFLKERYFDWITAHQKHPKETKRMLNLFLPAIGKKRLSEIDSWGIERYRSVRINQVKPITLNHELDALRAALNRAIDWRLLDVHPMRRVKRSKVDNQGNVRYLMLEEDKRLREGLDAREAKRRENREKFNQWRRDRGYKEFPQYPDDAYTDHLKPMVLVALNTGMRRGELFNVKWTDINFVSRILTVVGATAKSGKTRHIPLNDEAFEVLQKWYGHRRNSERVFPSHDGGRMDNISTSWAKLMTDAKIKNFRFHDCRHDFASKLVMAGVDLNTVRELLGHSDIKMTLRYAHLAPQKLAAAVAKLGSRGK